MFVELSASRLVFLLLGDVVTLKGSSFGPAGVSSSVLTATYGPTGTELSAGTCQVLSQILASCPSAVGVYALWL